MTCDCPKPYIPSAGKDIPPPPWGIASRKRNCQEPLFTSPFSVCPRVKNSSELPFQLQGQAAVQTTQGEAGAGDGRPQQA